MGLDSLIFPEEASVPEGHSPRSIHSYDILVKLTHFNHTSSLVPLVRMRTSLVLNAYGVANGKRGQAPSVLRPTFVALHVPVAESFLPVGLCLLSGCVGDVSSRRNRNEVSDGTAKDAHCRRQLGVTIWCVAVLQHSPLE